MAVSIKDSGSQTAVISTEHTLATITDAGVYQLYVDTSNMQSGDDLVLRVYGKNTSGDAEVLIYQGLFSDEQETPLLVSPIVISPHYFKVTLEQTGGTGRDFNWSIYTTGA